MKINNLEEIAKYRRKCLKNFLLQSTGILARIYDGNSSYIILRWFQRFETKKSFKDKVLISKGHATSALYPILRDYGIISKKDWDNWGKKSNLRIFITYLYQIDIIHR